jgi:hypothetical protein
MPDQLPEGVERFKLSRGTIDKPSQGVMVPDDEGCWIRASDLLTGIAAATEPLQRKIDNQRATIDRLRGNEIAIVKERERVQKVLLGDLSREALAASLQAISVDRWREVFDEQQREEALHALGIALEAALNAAFPEEGEKDG